MKSIRRGVLLTPVLAMAGAVLYGQTPGPNDWPGVGNDPGGMRFSPLTQVTPANVKNLQQAWVYDTGDPGGGNRGWQMTPIVIGNVMYFSTLGSKVVALNAETGTEIWKFDMKAVTPSARASKYGVSYWPGTAQLPGRIVVTTTDGLLFQLDAKTGTLVKTPGVVDLKVGMTEKVGGGYNVAATPAIYKNLAILAPATGEQGRYGVAGDPRAFDLLTGKEVWRFHTVPQPGEYGFGEWGPDAWQDRRGPGSWVPMTVDTARGIVFVPLGNATDQNYGGNRPGSDLYATSLVALNANTGKMLWYFQTTHHDIFDWDANAPPTLIDIVRDGVKVPAVALSSKQGLLFVFDRLTGKPSFGIEERPVPQSDAPGEHSSPTQPFPVKPGPIARDAMARDEVSKISPETEKSCKAQYDKAVNAGPYTPYGIQPSLVFPSSEGGGGWGGASFDPQLGLIIVNTRSLGTMAVLRATGTPELPSFAKVKIPFDDPDGYPCSAPPWGELMAVSATTGDFVWRVPLGEYKELTARGIPKTGTPNVGGPILTASGLTFIGATSDLMFRAFDTKTGQELWSTELPFNAATTPMTYQGKNGKQYIATVAGGGLDNFNKPALTRPGGNLVIAFALK